MRFHGDVGLWICEEAVMETNLDMGSDGTNLLAEIDEPTFSSH